MTVNLVGQWIGKFTGHNSGEVIIDIDLIQGTLQGSVSVHDDNINCPSFHYDFLMKPEDIKNDGTFSLQVTNPMIVYPNGEWVLNENAHLDTKWEVKGDDINITWNTSEDRSGKATCQRANANQPSKLVPKVLTWEQAKVHFSESGLERYLFRGQRNSAWQLQTGFHRRKRYNLSHFESHDIPLLLAQTSATTKHVFDLDKPLERAAFYALIQHHGYPTPLLDWTHSPFVAAFFAFREIVAADKVKYVRIFVFDKTSWQQDFNRVFWLKATNRHFSLLEPLALENPRMAPQQSIFSVTNVANIEDYLLKRSEEKNRPYLVAIDISIGERQKVLDDLSLIGITAASLFPGIDGICEYQASRNFS